MRFSAAATAAIQIFTGRAMSGSSRKNAVERAVVLGEGDQVEPAELGITSMEQDQEPDRKVSLKQVEQRHIAYVLKQVNGNKTAACRILDISRATLYAKLQGIAAADG